ncbi:MAG TPA: IS5 family transposase [Pseudolabrys sp.]|jgi:transposase, IS5 family
MRPRERRESGEQDLFRARLDQIIDMGHPLVRLARTIDWGFLEATFGAVYEDGAGRPPLPTRLMAGLAILKHTYDLSDEVVCELWLENPYYQYFCGEEFFRHRLPFDRSSMTHWRNRMGAERLQALLQESLAAATRSGAIKPADLARAVVDTTVQPKNVTFPTDAKLVNRAREKLVTLAKKLGVELRQSYVRVGKIALVKHQRYAHARQFDRAGKALRKLKTYLGRVIRDIARKIDGEPPLETAFASLLSLARRVRDQQRGQRGPKVYSLHAPEVECIGKGKPHKPYEFGVKVSVATTLKRCKGGQFVTHVQALPGNPYDGHTLARVIPAIEALLGNTIERLHTDAGYRGHNAPPEYKFKVYTAKQKRRVTPQIKREMRRRSAIEPVIGHLKSEHRMDRNYLAGRHGDASNAILAAVGYNFRRLIRWLTLLLALVLLAISPPPKSAVA